MIDHMNSFTAIKTGKTHYTVYYKNKAGRITKIRTFEENESWPLSIVRFFTDENTIKVSDVIIAGQTRKERFEKR